MDIKVKHIEGEYPRTEVVAVPSNEDGAFLVNHGSGYGTRVYTEMELLVSEEEKAQVLDGYTSTVKERFEQVVERPGFYKVAGGIGRVSITVPHSGNTVSGRVSEVLEVMPAVPAVTELHA